MTKRTNIFIETGDELCEPTLVFVNGKLSNVQSAPADVRKVLPVVTEHRKEIA